MIFNNFILKNPDEKEIGGVSDIPALTWPTPSASLPEANSPLCRSRGKIPLQYIHVLDW